MLANFLRSRRLVQRERRWSARLDSDERQAGTMTRGERDALRRTPVTLVPADDTSTRYTRRAAMRAERLRRPRAAAAPAPLSRREVVRLRSQTARQNAEVA